MRSSAREVIEVKKAESIRFEEYLGNFSCAGFTTSGPQGQDHLLAKGWLGMMQRCYNPDHYAYINYGGRGVFVCKRWHVLAVFIQDVKLLLGWQSKVGDWPTYELDKDYYLANYYSPKTCRWLSRQDNTAYRLDAIPVLATNPYGHSKIYMSVKACARAVGVYDSTILNKLRENRPDRVKKILGWKFEYADKNKVYRYAG